MKHLLIAIFIAFATGAGAQINKPNDCGDIVRARTMLDDRNYAGVVDQLSTLYSDALSADEQVEARWLRCQALAHLDTVAALAALDGFICEFPASPWRFKAYALAGDCLLETNPEAALVYYNKIDAATLAGGDQAALAYHKGYAYLQLGRLDRAEAAFGQAADNPAWRHRAQFYQAFIAYTRGDMSEAAALFEKSRGEIAPFCEAYAYLAQIYYVEANYRKALSAARDALAIQTLRSELRDESLRIAGESAFHLGDIDYGCQLLEQYVVTAECPARTAVYILGSQAYKERRYDEAINLLSQITDVDDTIGQSASLFIGQSFLENGNRDAALIAFEKAIGSSCDPDVQEAAYYNYAVAKFAGGRMPFGNSAAVFEEFLARYPNGAYTPAVQDYLVEGYIAEGNFNAALAAINRVDRPAPKVVDAKQRVLYALGRQAFVDNKAANAINYLSEAQAIGTRRPSLDAPIALTLGEALARNGEHSRAIDQFKTYFAKAPANDPNAAIARYDIAYAYFANGQYAEAEKHFSRFIDAPGELPVVIIADAQTRLADCLLMQQKLDKAAAAYTAACDILPSAGDYPLYQLAVTRGYQRLYREKIETLRQLIDRYPTSALIPSALLETTEAYTQLGDNDSAIATYQRLIAEFPSTEQGRKGYLQLAMTLLNSGRREQAVRAYKDVVELYPTSDEAPMAIDELKRIAADDGTLTQLAAWLATIDGTPRLSVDEADRLTFDAAEKAWLEQHDPERLSAYLGQFTKGAYRVNALSYLTEYASEQAAHRDVIAYATEIIERYPDSSHVVGALIEKGQAELALGMSADALATFGTLEQRASSPTTVGEARLGILRAAQDIADHTRAIEAADAILNSSTSSHQARREAQFARACALAASNRTDEALDQWAALANDANDIYAVKSHYYIAQHLFDQGRLDQSKEHINDIIDAGTTYYYWTARAFILLSDICRREGKDFEAREYLISLRKNYPGGEAEIFELIDSRLNDK